MWGADRHSTAQGAAGPGCAGAEARRGEGGSLPAAGVNLWLVPSRHSTGALTGGHIGNVTRGIRLVQCRDVGRGSCEAAQRDRCRALLHRQDDPAQGQERRRPGHEGPPDGRGDGEPARPRALAPATACWLPPAVFRASVCLKQPRNGDDLAALPPVRPCLVRFGRAQKSMVSMAIGMTEILERDGEQGGAAPRIAFPGHGPQAVTRARHTSHVLQLCPQSSLWGRSAPSGTRCRT